jgi:hypothetical protein
MKDLRYSIDLNAPHLASNHLLEKIQILGLVSETQQLQLEYFSVQVPTQEQRKLVLF